MGVNLALSAPPPALEADGYGNLVARANPAGEGNAHLGPWSYAGLGSEPAGWLPADWGFLNHWQMDRDPIGCGSSPIVEACVRAISETVALCLADHWRTKPDGGRERVTTSALSRVLKRPNDYQSRSDYIVNLVRQLYYSGNSYSLADRNDRFEVSALHLFDPQRSRHEIGADGTIFYSLSGNSVMEPRLRASGDQLRRFGIVPARDVLHVKLETEFDDPLRGISPLRFAACAIGIEQMICNQQGDFFGNKSRPSGVIETDLALTTEQVDQLRKHFRAAADWNRGGVPILTQGMKFHPLSISAKDAEMTPLLKQSIDSVAMVFGIPPAILGITDRASFASVEELIKFWLIRGLGFVLNHVETAFDAFFGLKGWPEEFMMFDESELLRPLFKDEMDGVVKGVQGGVFAPNEARRRFGMPDAKDGEEPRVQQQVVPLSAWSQPPPSTPAPETVEAPEPAAAGEGEAEDEETEEEALNAGDLIARVKRKWRDAERLAA